MFGRIRLCSSNVVGRKRRSNKAGMRPWLDGLEARVVLSTFKVNTTLDTVAVNLKTGKDASGHISLRSAIQAANAKSNSDTILIPKGIFTLTIPGANEDKDATGDLDITNKVTIKGKGATSTVIDGNSLDRVFQVLSGKVQISGVTIQHGQASEGGGLLNSGGNVTLTSVVVANNTALGTAGAQGSAGLGVGETGGNGGAGTNGGQALGGGIANEVGSLSLSKVTVISNVAQGGNGGNGGSGGDGEGRSGAAGVSGDTGLGGNGGAGGAGGVAEGGGVFNQAGATVAISSSSFGFNQATGGNGGFGGFGAIGFGGIGGDDGGSGAGLGGAGQGGGGGAGGTSGSGLGGGMMNLGTVTVSGGTTGFTTNKS